MNEPKPTPRAISRASYARRMHCVLDYIDAHLDEPVSIEELSRVACFSRFHFQRQFALFTGLTVARYIQRLKLRRASYALVFQPERSVTDIALEAGFGSSESFARAFGKLVAQTPSDFRTDPHWRLWTERLAMPEYPSKTALAIEIVDFPQTLVAVLEHHGSPTTVMTSVQRFIHWRKTTGLSPEKQSKTIGVPYSDPADTPPEAFQFDICGEVQAPIPPNDLGIMNKTIPAGRCARVCHRGSTDRIADSIYPVFRDWLPASGEELRDFPVYFHYRKRLPQVQEHEQQTDVYIPLKPAKTQQPKAPD